jgi:secreted Zn-dependent insulinase-like peptidase
MKLDNFLHLISDSAHPNQRFTYGNLETLSKEGVVDALHSFFQESYSSNLMTLTIKSDKDLGQLEHWLTEDSSFPKITNKNTKLNDFSELGLPN